MRIKLLNIQIYRNLSGKWPIEAEIDPESVALLRRFLDKIKDRAASAELSIWRDKRSLDANAYAWKLLSLIADTLTLSGCATTKDDLYIEMLKRYGQGGVVIL